MAIPIARAGSRRWAVMAANARFSQPSSAPKGRAVPFSSRFFWAPSSLPDAGEDTLARVLDLYQRDPFARLDGTRSRPARFAVATRNTCFES